LNNDGLEILRCLRSVAKERALRADNEVLAARVRAVKAFQHARFESTYADLLTDPRYAPAARFFLNDLYGPNDFTQRDDQFARVVPGLVRLFPKEIVKTVAGLAQLHELSEGLDTAMGGVTPSGLLNSATYGVAWRAVARRADRDRQINLMLDVGSALDRFTKNPLIRGSLRMMRGPASAAGLAALQQFLETGFDAFGAMRGAQTFLATIAGRERALAQRFFEGVGDEVDLPKEKGPI
jgi:hypothetical protein